VFVFFTFFSDECVLHTMMNGSVIIAVAHSMSVNEFWITWRWCNPDK